MGQAKQRGSREQRVSEAVAREAEELRIKQEKRNSVDVSRRRPHKKTLMLAAIMCAVSGGIR